MNFDRYTGMTYRDLARTETHGDCWHLIWRVYNNELGIVLPTYDSISLGLLGAADLAHYIDANAHLNFTVVDSPKKYDLVQLYGDQRSRYPTHIACAISLSRMIHLCRDMNVVIEPIRGRRWRNRVHSFYRHNTMI